MLVKMMKQLGKKRKANLYAILSSSTATLGDLDNERHTIPQTVAKLSKNLSGPNSRNRFLNNIIEIFELIRSVDEDEKKN